MVSGTEDESDVDMDKGEYRSSLIEGGGRSGDEERRTQEMTKVFSRQTLVSSPPTTRTTLPLKSLFPVYRLIDNFGVIKLAYLV